MFTPRSIELSGGFTLQAPPDATFGLFSPLGEKAWVPGWEPELLHPSGVDWAQGLIFRTRGESRDAIWVVTRLDWSAWSVEYHRVEPDLYVARVSVQCTSLTDAVTEVATEYEYVGLSERGNAEIAGMTPESYMEKMSRWSSWIQGRSVMRSSACATWRRSQSRRLSRPAWRRPTPTGCSTLPRPTLCAWWRPRSIARFRPR